MFLRKISNPTLAALVAMLSSSVWASVAEEPPTQNSPETTEPSGSAPPASAAPASQSPTGATDSVRKIETPVEFLEPSDAIVGAEVQSKDGQTIGTVKSVQTWPDGKSKKVIVALDEQAKSLGVTSATKATKTIGLAPNELTYDRERNVVFSSLTQAEIASLMAAQRNTKAQPAKEPGPTDEPATQEEPAQPN